MADTYIRPAINAMRPAFGNHSNRSSNDNIRLCDNENPFAGSYKLYPNDTASELTEHYLNAVNIIDQANHNQTSLQDTSNLFITRGAADALDLIFRAFLTPGQDAIAVTPPNFTLFNELATVYNIGVHEIKLEGENFDQLNVAQLVESPVKAIFLCDPNNPIGSSLNHATITAIINQFAGLIVIDEAYVEYAKRQSYRFLIDKHPNIVVIRSMSKAFGMAALRLGAVFANSALINAMRKVRLPFALPSPIIEAAIGELKNTFSLQEQITKFVIERDRFASELKSCLCVEQVFHDAGFVTLKAPTLQQHEIEKAGFEVLFNPMNTSGYIRISLAQPSINNLLVKLIKYR